MSDCVGSYKSSEIAPTFKFYLKDGKLNVIWFKHDAQALEPATRDVFIGEVGTIRFQRNAKHQISGFILNGDRVYGLRYIKSGK